MRTEAEIIWYWTNLMRNEFIVKSLTYLHCLRLLQVSFSQEKKLYQRVFFNEISFVAGSLTQVSRAEAVVSPGRWFGLVAVQNLLHKLLCWEASAAIPIAASPLDAMNCRERGGDTDVSQTATQTSTSPAPPYWHCRGETASLPHHCLHDCHHGPSPSRVPGWSICDMLLITTDIILSHL